MSYKIMSEKILDNIGGKENISQIGHCATRLRINVYDSSKVNINNLKNLEQSSGVILKNNQLQVIIGADVGKAYNDILEMTGGASEKQDSTDSYNKNKTFMDYVDTVGSFFAEVFMPIVPALITGGVILATNNFFVNNFGISAESGTVKIILAIFGAAFNMLPIYIGFFAARKLKMAPIMGAFLGALLYHPSISGVEGLDFLGIPITTVDYTGSVIPVILGVLFMYYVDKYLDKIIPDFIKYLLKPLLTMIIVVPITLIVLGPIGTQVSTYVGDFIIWLMDVAGFIALPILSIVYPYMVMLGIDKAIMPIGFDMISSLGWEITMVIGFISNLAIGAAALSVSRLNKNNEEKSGAYFTFGLTGLFGVTEPAFYGALIGRPKALIGVAIGAFTGGLIGGIFNLVSYVMGGTPGLFTLLFFLNPDGSLGNMILAIIVAIVTIVVTYVAVHFLLKNEEKEEVKENNISETEAADKPINIVSGNVNSELILSPITGNIVPIESVEDETFSQELLGKTFAVAPTEGILTSPVKGKVITAFPTGHAIGIESDLGVEILIHIGLDTVELNGKGFEVHVEEGDILNVGTPLVTIDLDLIEKEGYDPITLIVITNSSEYSNVQGLVTGQVNRGEELVNITK